MPFALIGWLLRGIGTLLLKPLQILFGALIVPDFVRLAYIHRVGRLHPKLTAPRGRPHSRPIRIDAVTERRQNVSIHTIAQLIDNIGYLIVNREAELKPKAVLVDCADADACRQIIAGISNVHYSRQLISIEAILTTHHHWDHMGGNEKMLSRSPGPLEIYGGEHDRVKGCTRWLRDGDRFEAAGLEFEAIHAPSHTKGSLIYRLVCENDRDCLFTGDTLFCGGCGACFEGTPQEMNKNFTRLLLDHHPRSLLFPGHEYTERILIDHFPQRTAHLAAKNPGRYFALCSALCRAHHLRALPFPAPTVPVRLQEEASYNSNFEHGIRACLLIKEALFNLREPPQADAFSYDDPPEQNLSLLRPELTVHPPQGRAETPKGFSRTPEHDRLRPKVAMDDAGQYVMVEPPWIVETNAANPFVVNWRMEVSELINSIDRAKPSNVKPIATGKLHQWRSGMNQLVLEPTTSRWPYRVQNDLLKHWPRTLIEAEEALSTLADIQGEFIPWNRLEASATQTYDGEPPAGAADLDRLRQIFTTAEERDRVRLREIIAFVTAHLYVKHGAPINQSLRECHGHSGMSARALAPMASSRRSPSAAASVPHSAPHIHKRHGSAIRMEQDVSKKEGKGSKGSARSQLRLEEGVHVHDFTDCWICQGQAVRGIAARQLELARTGTMYSNRRQGFTTIITAADSELDSETPGRSWGLQDGTSGPDRIQWIGSYPTAASTFSSYVNAASPADGDVTVRDLRPPIGGRSLMVLSGDFEVAAPVAPMGNSSHYISLFTLSSIGNEPSPDLDV